MHLSRHFLDPLLAFSVDRDQDVMDIRVHILGKYYISLPHFMDLICFFFPFHFDLAAYRKR